MFQPQGALETYLLESMNLNRKTNHDTALPPRGGAVAFTYGGMGRPVCVVFRMTGFEGK
jgi:hypothetical protein